MKTLFRAFFFLVLMSAEAQYIPNSAQSFQFIPLYNPAFTGIESFNDLKISYRYQWSGFGSYSPKFLNLAYMSRLVEPLDLAYNSLRVSDPSAMLPENLPRSKRIIHGMGGNVFYSQIGVLKSAGANISYAIHYPVASHLRLAGGISLLVENRKLDVGEITVRDPDEFYNHLLNGSTSQTDLNVRAGAVLYGPRFYFGFTYLPVVYTPIEASDLAMTVPFYRASVQAGFSFPLNADVTLKPSIVGLIQMNNEWTLDYHVKAFFRENIWLGISYRDIRSGVGLVGWNFNERLTASYSYEMSLGEFKQFNDGSHELVLSFRLDNFRKQTQYTW